MRREILDQILAAGAAKWPSVTFDKEAFGRHVAALGVDDARLHTHGMDLLLVSEVLQGNGQALQVFDVVLASVVTVVRRIDPAQSFIEEVTQELRIKLLTNPEPKLRGYGALGALVEWLRVAALRTALNLKRSDHLLPTDDVPVKAILVGVDDAHMKQLYLQELNAAVEHGFRRLSARERTLLRLHFIDGLSLDRIAVMYNVHRATVARWLVTIRQRLFDEVSEHLAVTHGLGQTDIRSLYRRMQDEVHVTISRVLQPSETASGVPIPKTVGRR